MFKVYADESGTHDITGQEAGASAPTLCGFIDNRKQWSKFCPKWKRALDNFGAGYFHFLEFKKRTGPFEGWSEEKRDRFLYEMAFLASEHAVALGGSYGAKRHHDSNREGNPFEIAIRRFFEDLKIVLNNRWPKYTGKIHFVFDACNRRDWLSPLRAVHAEFQKIDSRFGDLTFEDDKDPEHLPLQAADLLAFVSRQYAEDIYETQKLPEFRVLDTLLMRHRIKSLFGLNTTQMFKAMIKDQREKGALWKEQGIDRKYYPISDFPFHKFVDKRTIESFRPI